MNNLQEIQSMLEFLSVATLTAPSRGKREFQLAEYKRVFALLLDTKPIWDGSFEIRNAEMSARSNLQRLSDQFVESELVREASRILDAAIAMRED